VKGWPARSALRIGFLPLTDCAPLAIALEKGCFARHGLHVELRKAQSWSQIRDKLRLGELDASHMLITMPLQSALAGEPATPYAFTLSRNGNSIILGNALWNDGVRDAQGLASWLGARPGKGLRLAIVYPRGTQEYFLRSWLSRGGLSAGERIAFPIIAPQEMVGRLRKGEIDGFCVGEPWSRKAAASKLGRIAAESGAFIPGLGEKVLGVRAAWHRDHAAEHALVIRALFQAAAWSADSANRKASVEILASKNYVNTQKSVVEAALEAQSETEAEPGRTAGVRFPGGGAHFPARAHAAWYLEQMRLWGHVNPQSAARLRLEDLCLEDFFRSAVAGPISHCQLMSGNS
jgi:ABC-type nitrate/sulfonate/bicarbonate transport system substrate-binding protein